MNLSAFAQLRPGRWRESLLRHVVGARGRSSASAIALWKGADEPWRFRMRPASLRFAYCLATGRKRSWCVGHAPVDTGRLWVTVQAPRAGVWSLAPYSEVTDVHGVNSYPIAIGDPDPDLSEPGSWTNILGLATPKRAVWTTLGICWTWSYDAAGNVQLPTREQQRFMVYDAILNGARALAFYGGQNPKCWGSLDAAGGWNWTYWERVLEPLVREISAASPLAPALRNPGTTRELPTSDRSVRAISRRGRNGELGDRGAGRRRVSRRHDRWAPGCSERLRLRREPVGADRRWRAGGHRPLVRSRVLPDGVGGAFQLIVCQVRRRPEAEMAPA